MGGWTHVRDQYSVANAARLSGSTELAEVLALQVRSRTFASGIGGRACGEPRLRLNEYWFESNMKTAQHSFALQNIHQKMAKTNWSRDNRGMP